MNMTTHKRRRDADTYFALIRRFPLRPIKSEREYDAATAMLQDLMGRKLDVDEVGYYDTLLLLVNQYEQQNHQIDEDMTPLDALKALMAANDLKQVDLAQIIGSQSAASMILSGQRQLSKMHIQRLCHRFKVDASLFLGR